MKETEIKLIVLTHLAPYLFVGLIVFIGVIVTCTDHTNAMDNSINKQIEYVKQLEVLDKNGNGYRVTYVTIDPVTKTRLEEIQSRPAPPCCIFEASKGSPRPLRRKPT